MNPVLVMRFASCKLSTSSGMLLVGNALVVDMNGKALVARARRGALLQNVRQLRFCSLALESVGSVRKPLCARGHKDMP